MLKDTYSCTIVVTYPTKDKGRGKAVVASSSPPMYRVEQLKIFTKDIMVLTLKMLIAKVLSDRLLPIWRALLDSLID